MKTATAIAKQTPNSWQTFGHDLKRDWQAWSHWERLAVRALGISSLLLGAYYLGLSAMIAG